jgi:hypothetical protein
VKSQLPLCAHTSLLCYNTFIASTGSQLSARNSAIVSLDRSKVVYLPGPPQTIAGRSNTWIHRIAGYICTSQLHLSFVGLLCSLELRSEELRSLSFSLALPRSSRMYTLVATASSCLRTSHFTHSHRESCCPGGSSCSCSYEYISYVYSLLTLPPLAFAAFRRVCSHTFLPVRQHEISKFNHRR